MVNDLESMKRELFNQFNKAVKNERAWEKAENVNGCHMSMAALAEAIVAVEQEQRLAKEPAKKPIQTGAIING